MKFRIFAAASGECLVRNTESVCDEQRQRVQRDFRSGIRFTFDSENQEIRIFIPARRQSAEAFYAVGSIQNELENPSLSAFHSVIEDEFESRSHWSIREEAPEARLLRALRVTDHDTGELRDISKRVSSMNSEGPLRICVSDFRVAGLLLRLTYTARGFHGDSIVATHPLDSMDYDVLYFTRDQQKDAVVIEDRNYIAPGVQESSDSENNWIESLPLLRRFL